MLETEEVVQTIEHLKETLDDLVMRGLSSISSEQIKSLKVIHEECEKIGALYISSSLGKVLNDINSNPQSAAKAVMNTQASLRVFERLLTLEYAESELEDYLAFNTVDGEEFEDEDLDEGEQQSDAAEDEDLEEA